MLAALILLIFTHHDGKIVHPKSVYFSIVVVPLSISRRRCENLIMHEKKIPSYTVKPLLFWKILSYPFLVIPPSTISGHQVLHEGLFRIHSWILTFWKSNAPTMPATEDAYTQLAWLSLSHSAHGGKMADRKRMVWFVYYLFLSWESPILRAWKLYLIVIFRVFPANTKLKAILITV